MAQKTATIADATSKKITCLRANRSSQREMEVPTIFRPVPTTATTLVPLSAAALTGACPPQSASAPACAGQNTHKADSELRRRAAPASTDVLHLPACYWSAS